MLVKISLLYPLTPGGFELFPIRGGQVVDLPYLAVFSRRLGGQVGNLPHCYGKSLAGEPRM